ncbi:MAG: nitroreductase family deazaflavin-dependent oxidoreductase [Dehalococcoidia bacterium]|nr:nitroreductase family deazaflavin-dependent oxidoreductase [Dehalococcoidia bacterium]
MARYQKPDFFMAQVANPLIGGLARLGVGLRGARLLAVRGRTSGRWRSLPVNPVTVGGQRYLVAPRGDTQWVRNLRASGEAVLRLGRTSEAVHAEELPAAERLPILRAYLARWDKETGRFFGLDRHASDADLARLAESHPVFRLWR